MTADVMIASTNAITLDGKLVNLDGMGNRVAAMAFGPRKVILVVGMNKVAPDLDSAIARVKHYAAPVNAIRLGFPRLASRPDSVRTADRPSAFATCGASSKATWSRTAST
jgi:hypothetical protein